MRIISPSVVETFEYSLLENGIGISGSQSTPSFVMKIYIQRVSDSKWWDGDSWETGVPVVPVSMTEVDYTNLKGLYRYTGLPIAYMAAGNRYNVRYYNSDPTYGVDESEVVGVDNIDANLTQIDGSALSTHVAGMLPADLRDIVGSAVSTTTAQLGVNTVNIGGTTQTAEDKAGRDQLTSEIIRVVAVLDEMKNKVGTSGYDSTTDSLEALQELAVANQVLVAKDATVSKPGIAQTITAPADMALESTLSSTEEDVLFIKKYLKNKQPIVKEGSEFYLITYEDDGTTRLCKQRLEKFDGGAIGELTGSVTPSIKNSASLYRCTITGSVSSVLGIMVGAGTRTPGVVPGPDRGAYEY